VAYTFIDNLIDERCWKVVFGECMIEIMKFRADANSALFFINGYRVVLATEVTPISLAGAEPDTHQFYVTMVFMGDQMDRDSGKCHSNSDTGFGVYETKEVLI
jgi:hypothetical protein